MTSVKGFYQIMGGIALKFDEGNDGCTERNAEVLEKSRSVKGCSLSDYGGYRIALKFDEGNVYCVE